MTPNLTYWLSSAIMCTLCIKLTPVVSGHSREQSQMGRKSLSQIPKQSAWFQLIAGYFYGRPLEFFRDKTIQELINTLQILRVPSLLQKVYDDIATNFEQYGFFLLVQISYRFQLKWLKEKCEQDLMMMNFEQLNYNRYDLFQLKRETFEQILKLHELLRVNQNIEGLNKNIISQICKQYCKANQLPQREAVRLLAFEDIAADSISQIGQESEKTRKRKNSQLEGQNRNTPKVPTEACPVSNYQRSTQQSGGNQRTDELEKLKVINSEIQEKNEMLLQEIQKFKDSIKQPQTVQLSGGLDDFDQKLDQFKKNCQDQDEKFLKLKCQMEKLNPTLTLKKNINNKQKTGSVQKQQSWSIPKLSKD